MNRIDRVFENERKVLVPYITAGCPNPERTVDVMHALVAAGADLLELGMPFSDPMADGPVIQKACEDAIEAGVDLHRTLAMVREFRSRDRTTPIVLMGYLNPIYRYGVSAFGADAHAAGADGLLLVDAPLEETSAVASLFDSGMKRILLVAPTTPPERVRAVAGAGSGFIYYVSFTGITGAASLSASDVSEALDGLRTLCQLPLAVGFGIKTPADAVALASADAVVIGSALIEYLNDHGEDPVAAADAFLRPFRTALDESIRSTVT